MMTRNNDDDLLLLQHEDYYPNWYKTGLAGWGLTLNNGNLSNTLTKVTSFKFQNVCIITCLHFCKG